MQLLLLDDAIRFGSIRNIGHVCEMLELRMVETRLCENPKTCKEAVRDLGSIPVADNVMGITTTSRDTSKAPTPNRTLRTGGFSTS